MIDSIKPVVYLHIARAAQEVADAEHGVDLSAAEVAVNKNTTKSSSCECFDSIFMSQDRIPLGCRSWRCCKEGSSGIDKTFCVHCSRRLYFDIHLQAFEGLTLAEKVPTGGRRLTSQVRCDLDCIAARIKLAAVEKAKKGPPMQSFPLPKLK